MYIVQSMHLQVLEYDTSWTYVDLVKDWVSKCTQSVETIFNDDYTHRRNFYNGHNTCLMNKNHEIYVNIYT